MACSRAMQEQLPRSKITVLLSLPPPHAPVPEFEVRNKILHFLKARLTAFLPSINAVNSYRSIILFSFTPKAGVDRVWQTCLYSPENNLIVMAVSLFVQVL